MFRSLATTVFALFVVLGLAGFAGAPAYADEDHDHANGHAIDADEELRGLVLPIMNPACGRALLATKGCVACHAINGVGGEDAPALDASTMPRVMKPFSFAARMWRGAEVMILLQQDLFGEQIELSGQELFDIIAFAHDEEEQKLFSEADIPHDVLELIEHAHEGHEAHGHDDDDHDLD